MKIAKRHARPRLSWSSMLNNLIAHRVRREKADLSFALANSDSIRRTASGLGPDGTKIDPRAGARMVVNISSAHIPALCAASAQGRTNAYKNCYDLDPTLSTISANRLLVDAALPLRAGTKAAQMYFGALEMSGIGVRFYGDVCLVLKREAVPQDTIILDRNSYDLVRSPHAQLVAATVPAAQEQARRTILRNWSGQWDKDLAAIAAIKAINVLGLRNRRWTTGQISAAVRDDEDYIEVLKAGSFGVADLQEARISAADAAHDALVHSRVATGSAPRFEALLWSDRRRSAEKALREAGVPLNIVVGSGRTRD